MILATYPHYAAHLAPLAALVADDDVVLVAGHGDLVDAARRGGRRIVLAQHGAGQSYSSRHPHYPGGAGNDAASLFLAPNDHSADRWRQAYPGTPVAVVGSPILDTLPARVPGPGPVVAFAFHWDLHLVPETLSALPWYLDELPAVAASFSTIGTGHPRRHDLEHVYRRAGIEYVPDFAEVCRRADVLVFDNTSAGFEFASTGRPVVVLDAPWYRPDARHGLRFYDAAHVGQRVGSPSDLLPAIGRALERRPGDEDAREDALSMVYAYRSGAARRAADAIAAHA